MRVLNDNTVRCQTPSVTKSQREPLAVDELYIPNSYQHLTNLKAYVILWIETNYRKYKKPDAAALSDSNGIIISISESAKAGQA